MPGNELRSVVSITSKRIDALGADLLPGGALVLAADGARRRLYAPHEARMVIAGVALYGHVVLNTTGLSGELAEPTPVAGVILPTEAAVRLDLATGMAGATTRPSIINP